MIRPAGFRGAAFGTMAEGDARSDDAARRAFSRRLGVPAAWAWVTQVHGTRIADVAGPGSWGNADGIVTSKENLPLAVSTADCVPVILEGDEVAAVVHAGWRGTAAGVLEAMVETLSGRGTPPARAAIGPAIGPCCYEVGPEVADRFPGHVERTNWDTTSVDLAGAIASKLEPLEVWRSSECTFTSTDLHSFRRDGTERVQVAVGWLPSGSPA